MLKSIVIGQKSLIMGVQLWGEAHSCVSLRSKVDLLLGAGQWSTYEKENLE